MSYRKYSLLFITFVTLLLSGCSSTGNVRGEFGECIGGSSGIERCDFKIIVEINSVGSGFDSGKFSMDTSQSTVGFVQNLLSATLVQKRNGVIVGSLSFQFSRNGDDWSPVNTQSLNTWVANNATDNDVIEIGVSGFEFVSSPGTNLVVTEVVYDNTVMAGDSKSWYVSPQGNNQIMQ